MRVLITGAAGFIGSHLAGAFIKGNHHVTAIDNLTTGRKENYPNGLHVEDIADRDVLYGIANQCKPELVVHCAASYSNPDYWHRDTDTNVTGSINAALVARHHGARLVYFQTALPPISSYAISKLAAEQYLVLSGVPLLVFRLANMYGPRNLSGPIPTFWKRLSAGEACTVYNTTRELVYIDDLVDAVMLALNAGLTGRFDVCSGWPVPIERLYWAVAKELGLQRPPGRKEAPADDVKEMQLDSRPLYLATGWEASTTLEWGIGQACAWYKDNPVDQTFTHLSLSKG